MDEIGELGSVFDSSFLIDAVKMIFNSFEGNEQFFADLFICVTFEEWFDNFFFSGSELKFVDCVGCQIVADNKCRLVEIISNENGNLHALNQHQEWQGKVERYNRRLAHKWI